MNEQKTEEQMTGQDFYNQIEDIRIRMNRGLISYDEARKTAQPIIDQMNEIGKKIAAKYGKRHTNFTFASLMR